MVGLVQLHFLRLSVAGGLVLAAYFAAPEFFSEPLTALGAGLLAFLVSWPVFKWVKKKFFRPIVLFDAHGVVLTGDQALDDFSAMPGTPALVEALRRNYCVCLFTNMSPELFNFWNSKWRFTDKFDYVFVSGYIKAKKPDPHAFLAVVRRLGCKPSDIVFFDDIMANVDGAASIGINALHFTSAAQAARALRDMGLVF